MKTIEVSDEIYDGLIEISKDLNTQDHRATAMPYFFQVKTKKEVPAFEGSGDIILWYNTYSEKELRTEEEIRECISEHIYENDNSLTELTDEEAEEKSKRIVSEMDSYDMEEWLESHDFVKYELNEESVYENCFFTEKACELHIKQNKHNLNKPVSYLNHAFRNPEMELVMKFLCELNGGETHK